jgi:hypothetical protein
MDSAQEEGNEFPEVERCLMIFGSSQAYESRRQRRITGQEVNALHTLAASTWLWCSQTAITFDPEDYPDRVPI